MCVTVYREIVKKVLTSGLIKAQVWDKVWNYMVSYKIGMVNGIVFHWDVLGADYMSPANRADLILSRPMVA